MISDMEDDSPRKDGFFKRLFGLGREEEALEEDLLSAVEEGQEKGLLLESEAEVIQNLLRLQDKDVGDLMVPRRQMKAVDGAKKLSEVLPEITESHFSRFPVYQGELDHVVGILHVKDLLARVAGGQDLDVPVAETPKLLHHAVFFPESKPVRTLLGELRDTKTHMAIVVDEYGQTAGIICLEDVLEEIVGSILDEHDVDIPLVIEANGTFYIDGTAEPEEVFSRLGLSEEGEEGSFETISGFLIARLGHVPEEGELPVVEVGPWRFTALETRGRMIARIRAERRGEE